MMNTRLPSVRPGSGGSPGRSRGQATVEMALILPMLLLCCMGVLDFGRGLNAWVVMQNAAREGAFFYAKNPTTTCANVQQVVLAEAAPLLTGAQVSEVQVQTSNLSHTYIEDTAQVTVTYNFQFLTPIITNNASLKLVAAAAAPVGPGMPGSCS